MRRRWLIDLASIAGLAITSSACVWQYSRGVERDRLAAEMASGRESAPIEISGAGGEGSGILFRRVRATGEWVPSSVVLLDNQARGPSPGYHVFTALRLSGGRHVLVKRGWIAGSADRSRIPEVPVPAGETRIEGIALPPAGRFFELGEPDLSGRVWQNVTVDRAHRRFGLDFVPLVLEQHAGPEDGLVRQWPVTGPSSARNYGYAFQWGAMATLIVVLNVFFRFRRLPSPRAS